MATIAWSGLLYRCNGDSVALVAYSVPDCQLSKLEYQIMPLNARYKALLLCCGYVLDDVRSRHGGAVVNRRKAEK